MPYIAPILSPNFDGQEFSPLKSYLESLTVIERLPVETAYPGHGNSFSAVRERIEEIRSHHAQKREFWQNALDAQPRTTLDICCTLPGGAVAVRNNWEKFMAFNDAYIYLQDLCQDGALQEREQDGRLYYFANIKHRT